MQTNMKGNGHKAKSERTTNKRVIKTRRIKLFGRSARACMVVILTLPVGHRGVALSAGLGVAEGVLGRDPEMGKTFSCQGFDSDYIKFLPHLKM